MNKRNKIRQKGPLGPYKDLFIYYLNGEVGAEDETNFQENYFGNWLEDNSSFLFFSAPSIDRVNELLSRRPDLELVDNYHFTYEEWQGGGLEALRIGKFLITPPWEEREDEKDVIKIILDPGVVFGTGLHPTTKDSLRALEFIQKIRPLKRVLDLGTGTGILAIAAVFLGAESALAVDLNPLSVKTARRNVGLNHLEGAISIVEGRAGDFVNDDAELIVANIHYEVIERLLDVKQFHEKIWFIISGLMRSQAREIKNRLARYDLKLIREWDHEMIWHTMLLENEGLNHD